MEVLSKQLKQLKQHGSEINMVRITNFTMEIDNFFIFEA